MKNIVFFDVDNVLIEGQSQKSFALFLFKNNKLPLLLMAEILWAFLLYRLNLLKSLDPLRSKALLVLKGLTHQEGQVLFQRFYETVLRAKIKKEALEIIQRHRDAGDEVVLLSASLHEIVELLKDGVGLSHQISTRLEIKGGIYTGVILGEAVYGAHKVSKATDFMHEHGVDPNNTYAYADHYSDVGLLKMVKYPHVINPDADLRELAKKMSWDIHSW